MFKKINPIKTKIFKIITKSFKNHNVPFLASSYAQYESTRVLIIRPNHRLGNQLLLSPLIQEIRNQIPNCEIDILVNGTLSNVLYENYNYVNKIHNLPKKPFKNLNAYINTAYKVIRKKYDIGILGCEDSNSGKIFLKLSRSTHKVFNSGLDIKNKPIHIAKYPIYNFMVNQVNSIESKKIIYPKIDLKLFQEEINDGNDKLNQLFGQSEKVIAIFTFATGNKIMSKEWWRSLNNSLKKEFPDFKILEILPKENVSQIDFTATHYHSQDLREIASVIENCHLFIGADSGMMHLAVSTETPTFGLFNTTNPEIYTPYGKNKMSILINEFSIEKINLEAKKILFNKKVQNSA